MKIQPDHFYVSVGDMDRAIRFYEGLLGVKIRHREGDTWADFDHGTGYYLGLINPNIIDSKRIIGNNAIPVFFTDNVDEAYKRIKVLGAKISHEISTLNYTDYFYRTFLCEDSEGNLIEIAQYDRNAT